MTSEERSFDQRAVEWCMKAAGQKVRAVPKLAPKSERELRAKLILEEALETVEAMGFAVYVPGDAEYIAAPPMVRVTRWGLELQTEGRANIKDIADGCADIMVVTLGTLSAFGIDATPLMNEVHKKNKEKFPGGKAILRDDNKFLKPPGWVPPDIKSVLIAQGWKPNG